MIDNFRTEAARLMLSSPPMWRWAEPCFHPTPEAEPTSSNGLGFTPTPSEWVDVEALKALYDEPISDTECLMLAVALDLLEGGAHRANDGGVHLSEIIAHFDNENWQRFIDAILHVRLSLKGGGDLRIDPEVVRLRESIESRLDKLHGALES